VTLRTLDLRRDLPERWRAGLFRAGVPIVINITSYMIDPSIRSRRIFMAGGNGLAVGLMVIGFIVLFLVPLAFLTSLF